MNVETANVTMPPFVGQAFQPDNEQAVSLERLTYENGTGLGWRHWPAEPMHAAGSSQSLGRLTLKGCEAAQARLVDGTVVVLGLGAVGGRCFEQFARLGVGHLIGVDPDSYGEDSWLTQPALAADAGKSKALVQGERAHAIHPGSEVVTAKGFAQDLPLRVLRQADVLVVAGDNLELVVWAGNMAASLGKPLIEGSVQGESWTAIVRGYDLRDPRAACPACALGRREWSVLTSRFGCDPATARQQGVEPTRTLPNVCAMAAELATTEALKWLLGIERGVLRGEELAYCLRSHRSWPSKVSRNENCRCPHQQWTLVDVIEDPAALTLARLTEQRTGTRISPAGTGLQIRAERPWISSAGCAACGRQTSVRRFAKLGSAVGKCPCGAELLAAPMGMRSVMPETDRQACWDSSLAGLGLMPGDAVGIAAADDWTYFILQEVT